MGFFPKWLYRRAYVKIESSQIPTTKTPLLVRNGVDKCYKNNHNRCTKITESNNDHVQTKTFDLPVTCSCCVQSPTKNNFIPNKFQRTSENIEKSENHRRTNDYPENSGLAETTMISPENSVASSIFTVRDPNRPKKLENPTDFETAIKLCGYGKFHYSFVLLCGMIFLCAGCQNGINAYILPSAECDLSLTSGEKGLLNVAFLGGGVISAVFWGIISDAYGRKNILVGTLLVDGLLTLAASCAQSFTALLIFRAISGFTIGAPGSLVFTYLGEFHAAKQRVKSICYVGFFWTLSWLVLPGVAWIIIPMRIKWEYDGFLYNSWRLYYAIIGLPTVIVALVLMTYPESPKFLLYRGKSEEALQILRNIYASNAGRHRSEYPVKYLIATDESEESGEMEISGKDVDTKRNNFKDPGNERNRATGFENNGNKPSILLELLSNVYQQIRSLGSPPFFGWALLCWTIYFTNMFGYYGLGLWFPELFNRFETFYKNHPNVSVSVCELMNPLDLALPDNSTSSITFHCDGTSIDQRVFINTLTINGVCLLGNVVSGYLADRVGRRTIPVTTMVISGLAGFAIYFVKSSAQNLIVACVFSLAISTANFVIGAVVVDIFPTHIGAMAICMMTFFGRVGAIASNLAFGMLLDISCEVPIFLVGGIVLFGGLLALFLPKAKR